MTARTPSTFQLSVMGLATVLVVGALLWGLVFPYDYDVLGTTVGTCRGLDVFDRAADLLGRKNPCLTSATNRITSALSVVAATGLLSALFIVVDNRRRS